jgi:hypothetical protein
MADIPDNARRALSLLVDKGVFAKGVDVRQLVELSSEVAKLGGDHDIAAWTLINKDYVLTGKAMDPSGPVVIGRG